MNKYRIRKMTEESLWFEPFSPLPGWWLYRPDGKVKSLPTWDAAIEAGWNDGRRQNAVNNRLPLGPIGTVPHA